MLDAQAWGTSDSKCVGVASELQQRHKDIGHDRGAGETRSGSPLYLPLAQYGNAFPMDTLQGSTVSPIKATNFSQ